MPYSPTFVPKMSCTSPNGMIASAITAVTIEMIGAITNSKPIEVEGRNCSFVSSLRMSASGCRAP